MLATMSGTQRVPSRQGMVPLNTAITPEHKAIIVRTATALDVSQTVALGKILDHLELTTDGLPTWVAADEEAALFK